jgi:hypothetical protein
MQYGPRSFIRAESRLPARSGLALEVIGGAIAHQFQGVATFN